MKLDDKSLLERATQALRTDVPDSETIASSALKVARGLGIEMNHEAFTGAIRNCDDVQQLLNAYRAGTLPEGRALLVQAHLRECGSCLRSLRDESAVSWTAPQLAIAPRVRPQAWGWALALSCAMLIPVFFIYKDRKSTR